MIVLLLVTLVYPTLQSPPMCHCPSGGVGYQCPNPVTLNCPPPPPCPAQGANCQGGLQPLPTFAPITMAPGIMESFNAFTLPTLAPFGGGATPAPPLAPQPPPPQAPTNGQESLVGFQQQQQQQNNYPQQHYQQPQQYQQNLIPVDQTTVAPRPATLPSETYVDLENPENAPAQQTQGVYENEPNQGYRQPVRREANPAVNDKCNDERLKRIIEQNIDENASSSKRKIQKAASEEIGGLFDVICSSHDFSYLANTQLFCEAGNDDVTCFAFLHSLIQ